MCVCALDSYKQFFILFEKYGKNLSFRHAWTVPKCFFVRISLLLCTARRIIISLGVANQLFFWQKFNIRKCNKVLQNGCAYVFLDTHCVRYVFNATDNKRVNMHNTYKNYCRLCERKRNWRKNKQRNRAKQKLSKQSILFSLSFAMYVHYAILVCACVLRWAAYKSKFTGEWRWKAQTEKLRI